jgi:hypothetical protein
VTAYVSGRLMDDLRLDAAAMVTCALNGDAEGLAALGDANADPGRSAALVGTLVALVTSVLRALPEDQREGVLAAWRRP